jgi:hypothetical protein
MPRDDSKEREGGSLGRTSAVLPVSQRVNADSQCRRELLLGQIDEAAERDDVFPARDSSSGDALALLPLNRPGEIPSRKLSNLIRYVSILVSVSPATDPVEAGAAGVPVEVGIPSFGLLGPKCGVLLVRQAFQAFEEPPGQPRPSFRIELEGFRFDALDARVSGVYRPRPRRTIGGEAARPQCTTASGSIITRFFPDCFAR